MRTRPFLPVIATCVALTAALGAEAALAVRPPTESERTAIAKNFKTPPNCLRVRVSTVDPSYAFSEYRQPPKPACMKFGFDGIAILKRRGRAWKPVFEGSSFTCADIKVPLAVKRDLKVRGC